MKVKQVNHGTNYSSISGRIKMWLLLTVASLISALGTTQAFFGRLNHESPEVTMNIVSYWRKNTHLQNQDITMIQDYSRFYMLN